MLVTIHHIVFDGWSQEVFLRELSTLYTAFHAGLPSPLSPVTLHYADYAVWQRQQTTEFAQQLTYWKEQLAGAPALLDLPTDFPRPSQQTFVGTRYPFTISTDQVQKVRTLSHHEHVTTYMILLAVYQVLLARYSGQTDLVVGTPIAGRTRVELEEMLGFLVNTLALRVSLAANPSFAHLLQQVREVALQAYAHQDVPFEQVVQALQPERTLSHSPIFQVMFSLQNTPALTLSFPALTCEIQPLVSRVAQFDLTMDLVEIEGRIEGEIEYNTDLFREETIARLVTHYLHLLAQLVDDPTQAVFRVSLLTAQERQLQLVTWNQTAAPFPQDRCLHELFEEQVQKSPQAPAVLFEDTQLSYEELNARANQLAHVLQGYGVTPDTLVGLCVERSLEMVVGMLGILKAGGAYVPLDPDYPAERLRYMLTNTGVNVLLTQAHLQDRLPMHQARVLCLDADWSQIAQAPSTNLSTSGVHPAHLAYVIYTSGSTGLPKGVMVPHHGVMNVALAQTIQFGLQVGDRVLQAASISFDAATSEMLLAWGAGATLCLVSREVLLSGPGFQQYLQQTAISMVILTPSLLSTLTVEALPALHTIAVAGEACSSELVERWAAGRRFFNLYGPTEASIWSTVMRCEVGEGKPLIGRPIINTQVYILDQRMQPVPVGIPGELYIGGVGVTRGYLQRPDITADRFVPHPFSNEPGVRLYRTGDVVKYRATGEIEYIGRVDHQVKIRGQRVELGEIEAVLRLHPAIQECVVLLREDIPGEKHLVAYVIFIPTQERTQLDLRNYLSTKLASYMLPTFFVTLPTLPLTSNGKINRQELPPPEITARNAADILHTPFTPTEELLITIWQSTLKHEHINTTDNFFEIGGHSLLATHLVAQIRQTFHVEIPLRLVFNAPVLAELAHHLDEKMRLTFDSLPTIQARKEQEPPPPLSFGQERLWFLDHLDEKNIAYHMPLGIRLQGALDLVALEHSLTELVARHAILRTTLRMQDGQPVQFISPQQPVSLRIQDLTTIVDALREEHAHAFLTQEIEQPFNLAQGPLLRHLLLRLSPQEHILVFTWHHSISDGWSREVFLRELSTLYTAFHAGLPSPLSPVTLHYADYAVWQRQQTTEFAQQLTYWKEQLAGAPALLDLPTDFPRPSQQTFVGTRYPFTISTDQVQKVRTLSHREHVTTYMILLAVYQVLLARYSGQTDLVVGTPIAGRTRVELEEMLGFLVNTLALRVSLAANPSFAHLLQQVREVALQAYAHQDVPFEQVVQALQPERTLSHSPIFQVMFSLQNTPALTLSFPALTCEIQPLVSRVAQFDLTMDLVEIEGRIEGEIEYNTDLFREETIARLVTHYLHLLAQLVDDPTQAVFRVSLLTAQERQLQLVTWNQTAAPFPQDRCLHALFEEQVQKSPQAPAVLFEDTQLSYEELNARANQLAHVLQGYGVTPDTLVGLCVERSLEMVVGMLGILKAGGAYVPLDPDYPAERLRYMLTNTGVNVLLTQAHLQDRLPMHQARVLCLDADWSQIAQAPSTNLSTSGVHPAHLAYVIYTSGSTGLPKGVMVQHRELVNLLLSFAQILPLSIKDTFIALTTITFDIAGLEIFLPLISGARIALANQETARDSQALARIISRTQATVMQATPVTWKLLLANGWDGNPDLVALCGGETLPKNLADELKMRVKLLWNVYGPTETTIWSCSCHISPEVSHITIGYPIANTQIYILDQRMQPVPVGVTGELYIGGAGLARGYLYRPDITAEKFLPNPFSKSSGTRLYRTGDLARYCSDGAIEILGRNDQQVKLRGHRIELGEIEAALNEHSAIKDSVAVLREGISGEKQLVAYVTLNSEHIVSPSDLRSYLNSKLPPHMLPAAFVPLPALPLTSNGKLDRKALPIHAIEDITTAYEAAHTDIEALLVTVWETVLERTTIGIHDNFFALGGDSIKSISVIVQARQKGLTITSKQIFQHQTIAQLARAVQPLQQDVETSRIIRPTRLMPIQHWFFEQQFSDLPHHYQSSTLHLLGDVNLNALRQSIEVLLNHHDALRTRFIHNGNQWEASTQATISIEAFWEEEIIDESDAYRISEIVSNIAYSSHASFNLEQGHLLRAVVITTPSMKDGYLVLMIHQLVIDAVSWQILLADLVFAYEQLVSGEIPLLPSPTLQMQQLAEILVHKAREPETLRAISYWEDQAKRMVKSLPFVDPPMLAYNLDTTVVSKRLHLSLEETRALVEVVPSAYHAHINEILLAALSKAYTEWIGTSQILFDFEHQGRNLDGQNLARTIGWCTVLFPVLIDLALPPRTDIVAVVRSVKEQVRVATQHGQAYTLLKYLHPDKNIQARLNSIPQAPIRFSFIDSTGKQEASSKRGHFFSIEQSHHQSLCLQTGGAYLINIYCQINRSQFTIDLFYHSNLEERMHIDDFANSYITALRQIIAVYPTAHTQGLTATDFPDAGLDQKQLDRLVNRLKKPR
ncbi:hypothetical protein KDAU_64390 [Dictyobacter aurantiacus]|uniref:Carrier domain-containing protein n=1 Tax=Dictyobacter aurantiacus TaxID=1936993 RepID=A0A401ZQM1_9CHLR|nr:hypothetical protein KDAU_64390 [Dictyobacter aurantiacus]